MKYDSCLNNFNSRMHKNLIRNVRAADRDCGTKYCYYEVHVKDTCTIYVDASPTELCDFPCSLDYCVPEIYHYVNCPSWNCVDKTTTLPPDPSPSPSPPPSDSQCTTAVCISSVALNVVIFVVLGSAAVVLRKKYRSRPNNSIENPLFDDGFDLFSNENPIIRGSEQIPLLRVGSSRSTSLERLRLTNQDSTVSTGSSATQSVSVPLTPVASAPILQFHENTF